jgi:hypothetical protein
VDTVIVHFIVGIKALPSLTVRGAAPSAEAAGSKAPVHYLGEAWS